MARSMLYLTMMLPPSLNLNVIFVYVKYLPMELYVSSSAVSSLVYLSR